MYGGGAAIISHQLKVDVSLNDGEARFSCQLEEAMRARGMVINPLSLIFMVVILCFLL